MFESAKIGLKSEPNSTLFIQIRLAARAKMEGNLKDLLPENFQSSAVNKKKKGEEDPLEGKLKFSSEGGKGSTVSLNDLWDDMKLPANYQVS